ncbi:TPA: hypothetical protein ACIKQ0_003583, partial [Enterococcus faecalis]
LFTFTQLYGLYHFLLMIILKCTAKLNINSKLTSYSIKERKSLGQKSLWIFVPGSKPDKWREQNQFLRK